MLKGIYLSMVGLFMFCSLVSADLVDNSDGTVTDTATGLMWQQAEAANLNWWAALVYCEALELAGYDDWRLPNRNELHSIVDYEKYNPAIDTVVFPGASPHIFYWSSTTNAGNTYLAWTVHFAHGLVQNIGSKSSPIHVRAVRGGQ